MVTLNSGPLGLGHTLWLSNLPMVEILQIKVAKERRWSDKLLDTAVLGFS